MNIELTTDNLRKSCRVCLNQGEINIWEHSVSLSDQENFEDARNFKLTAIELFKIYKNYDTALLDLHNELKLLCYSCLDELTNSYLFYKKARNTNIQIQRLYNEAQKIEAEQLVDVVVEVLENEYNNEESGDRKQLQNYNDEEELVDETEAEVKLEDFIEQIPYEKGVQFVEDNNTELKAGANNSSHDETQLHGSTDSLNVCDKAVSEQNDDPTPDIYDEIKTGENNPIQFKCQREKTMQIADNKSPSHEDESLVVTQFLPATAHIVLDKTNSPATTGENDSDGSVNGSVKLSQAPDLSTVDYAAVEVKRSNLQQIVEEELQLNNTKPPSSVSSHAIDSFFKKEQMEQSANTVYVCQYCPQAFAAPHYLIAHVRKSHVCKYCTQAFSKSMDLFVHIRQAHHQHKCAICNKELSSHSNLRGHIKRVHGIRLPAQVALLDYRPPNGNIGDEKANGSMTAKSTLEEMDMYF